ncbi:DUF5959 family protein [Streptomyces asoensis]|uniref:DUF5959 family protein n=1 Tax=Streptomyces asoensis TaxID=249586 RepID=UPI0033F6A31A
MGSTDDVIDLIHLADRPGTSRHSVSVRVLGRSQPGNLFGHDFLECEIVMVAESLSASFPVTSLARSVRRGGSSPDGCGPRARSPRR